MHDEFDSSKVGEFLCLKIGELSWDFNAGGQ